MARHAGQCLRLRERKESRRHGHRQQQRCARGGAGIAIRRHCDGRAGGAQRCDGRQMSVRKTIKGDRQQHGNCARGGERLRLGGLRIFQMIAGECAAARRKARTAYIAQLFGVHLDWNAQGERGIKEPLRLAGVEGDLLAKDIDRINEPFGMQRWQPLARDGVDVLIGSRGVFGRQRVRREERRLHSHGKAFAKRARSPQHLRLICQGESVAGFDFNRRHPLAQERGQARRRALDQLFETRPPRRPHGGEDPAAARRNLCIARPAQAFGIFARTRAGKHQVRVAIDECRGEPSAPEIVALNVGAAQLGRLLPRRSEPGNATVAHREHAFFEHAHALIAGGDARVVPEANGVGIQGSRHDAPMLAVLLAIHRLCRILSQGGAAPTAKDKKTAMIYDSILGTIGRTPIVRVQRLAPKNVTMYVKCEFFNPASSVKDRLAIAIIEDAEKSGKLKPGQTVVEATSGNTGIALAMVCAAKGYPFVATMVETFSVERRKLMRLMGAKVILTPAAERGTGMVKKAEELAKKHGWFLARQFENPANPAYHRNTTAPEILSDFAGRRLDFFVTGWGTGGTLTGVGEMMKVARPEVKIVVAEPQAAALLSGKPFAPHKIQGWTPDFIPAVLNRSVADRILTVTDAEAIENARALAQSEGIMCGISSGGTFAAAKKVAAEAPEGAVILAMLPDTAERYLSTALFEGIAEGSDPEP